MIREELRIHPEQEELTEAQRTAASRFARQRSHAYLAPGPVAEARAEQWLRRAYKVAGLTPPRRIVWLDGPEAFIERVERAERTAFREGRTGNIGESVWNPRTTHMDLRYNSVLEQVWSACVHLVDWEGVGARVREPLWQPLLHCLERQYGVDARWNPRPAGVRESVTAYDAAPRLALHAYLHTYFAPNSSAAFAHFNELVSGYWLGLTEGIGVALVARKPRILELDEAGCLHSATGACVQFPDGWGLYAWHGVVVPEKVILAPETLTRDNFLNATSLEVRRAIQERMGDCFIHELGGIVLDEGARGRLWEVMLPDDDPERVAHYVQVRDASRPREYYLRVPPTIQTAAEALAWTFNLTVEGYQPR